MTLSDPSFWLTAVAMLACFGLSALCAAALAALAAASASKLRALPGRRAKTALRLAENATHTAATLALVDLLATLATVILTLRLLPALPLLESLIMAAALALLMLFAEGLARSLAAAQPEAGLIRLLPLVQLARLLSPPVRLSRLLLRRIGVAIDPNDQMSALRDDIAGAIALGHSGGAMEKDDRDRLLGALDLSDRTVDEIMRHRRQIEMINAADAPGDILTQMLASPHSRLPVYRDDEENIVGVIHTKDLLREVDRLVRGEHGAGGEGLEALDIVKVAMKPYFIPDTTALDEQMREFLKRRTHFALVVDEYGGLQGLITLEDILEEIVGEIHDEFDVAVQSTLKRAENGDYIVEGAMTIRDLNRAMDWGLPDDEANTIAGLVIHEAQMIPAEGQVFHFHGFRIEIAQRLENRITKLKLRPIA